MVELEQHDVWCCVFKLNIFLSTGVETTNPPTGCTGSTKKNRCCSTGTAGQRCCNVNSTESLCIGNKACTNVSNLTKLRGFEELDLSSMSEQQQHHPYHIYQTCKCIKHRNIFMYINVKQPLLLSQSKKRKKKKAT